tara:strand:+ start:344 stop:1246 length:903 start_codon:yes stop_codon:yes gene_type:complete
MKCFLKLSFFLSLLLSSNNPYVVVLGIAQDGGAPHAGCEKICCENLWKNNRAIKVASIGIVDPRINKSWIIDATPDFPHQIRILQNSHKSEISGIFLTHAHMGHYTGLLHLGREVMGAKNIPVFSMSKMKDFLEKNGPWNQLITLNNINIIELKKNREVKLSDRLFIEPFLVPHRDEYSETVGYRIMSDNKSLVYIPDIDKWEKWDQDIFQIVLNTDFALVDGTFYSQDELPDRNMGEIPHPFIIETMETLFNLNTKNRNKVYFIHFNHSNPAIIMNGPAEKLIKSKRFNVAREGDRFNL